MQPDNSEEHIQDWLQLQDERHCPVEITPREPLKPSPEEEHEWETPLQRARRIMKREGEI